MSATTMVLVLVWAPHPGNVDQATVPDTTQTDNMHLSVSDQMPAPDEELEVEISEPEATPVEVEISEEPVEETVTPTPTATATFTQTPTPTPSSPATQAKTSAALSGKLPRITSMRAQASSDGIVRLNWTAEETQGVRFAVWLNDQLVGTTSNTSAQLQLKSTSSSVVKVASINAQGKTGIPATLTVQRPIPGIGGAVGKPTTKPTSKPSGRSTTNGKPTNQENQDKTNPSTSAQASSKPEGSGQ